MLSRAGRSRLLKLRSARGQMGSRMGCLEVLEEPVVVGSSLVGPPGFEPGTSCTPSKRASQAAPRPDRSAFSAEG